MKETDQAKQSFEDYWGLGPGRSLPKLVEHYKKRHRNDPKAASPTRRLKTLSVWSAKHNWQARLIARIEEEAEEVRKVLRERTIAFRQRVAAAIEVDVTRLLKRLENTQGEMLTESAADLERLTKLLFQLAEMPLADRTELTGAGGGPVQIARIEFSRDGHEDKAGKR